MATTIDQLGQDLLQNVVSRLPALSFASVACVSRSLNFVSNRVLSRPKLVSACSFNPFLHVAVEEVVNKVLSQPIRPHFVIASVGSSFDLNEAHRLITAKLHSKVPVVTTCSDGIIGRDTLSDEFKEWKPSEDDDPYAPLPENANRAIMLIVGYMPGLKVKTIPLLNKVEDPNAVLVDKFVTDIRAFSTFVSGCQSPAAVIMFSHGTKLDMANVMGKIDYAMSPETVIVGDGSCFCRYTNGSSRNTIATDEVVCAVALVFVKDKNKPLGIGETQFHAVLSNGLMPVGSAYEVASSDERRPSLTALTARREGSREILGGGTLRNQAYEAMGYRTESSSYYIGITKRRKSSIGQENVGWMTYLAFHQVAEVSQGRLFVDDIGIKTGDNFRFYRPDSTTALSSVANVSNHLRSFKQGVTTSGNRREVFGGLIFSSCERGESFFGQPNIDSSPFLDNFPGVTLAGTICCREFGRGDSTPYVEEYPEQKSVRCCVHEYSSVYFIMSYTP